MLDHPYIGALYTLSSKRDNEFRQSLSIAIGLTVFLVLKLDSFRQVFQIMLLFMSFYDVISYSPKPFKFFDICTDHPQLCRKLELVLTKETNGEVEVA